MTSSTESTTATAPLEVLGSTSDEFAAAARRLIERGHGVAHALYRSAMHDARFDPSAHGIGAEADALWRRHFAFDLPTVVARRASATELGATITKLVLRGTDGLEYECVDVPIGTRHRSLCVSTQVGCGMACRFCETARLGKLRDLTAAEIVGQVVVARSELGHAARSIVFMGMGEALDNFDALIQTLRVLTDRRGLGYAHDRLTVCTVGHVDGIRRLTAERIKRLNLSVSLNSADDTTRAQLMPVAARLANLAELQRALIEYRQRANFQLGVHYCLMPGINDTPADARAVAAFCAPLGRCLLQVIPYNPGSVPLTRAPTDAEVANFVELLRAHGTAVRRRITKGRSLMAACGQLGNPQLRRAGLTPTS